MNPEDNLPPDSQSRALRARDDRGLNLGWQSLGWQPRWFARTGVPMVAWAFSFDEERTQQAGQTWLLEHRLALLDLGEGQEFDGERVRAAWAVASS